MDRGGDSQYMNGWSRGRWREGEDSQYMIEVVAAALLHKEHRHRQPTARVVVRRVPAGAPRVDAHVLGRDAARRARRDERRVRHHQPLDEQVLVGRHARLDARARLEAWRHATWCDCNVSNEHSPGRRVGRDHAGAERSACASQRRRDTGSLAALVMHSSRSSSKKTSDADEDVHHRASEGLLSPSSPSNSNYTDATRATRKWLCSVSFSERTGCRRRRSPQRARIASLPIAQRPWYIDEAQGGSEAAHGIGMAKCANGL